MDVDTELEPTLAPGQMTPPPYRPQLDAEKLTAGEVHVANPANCSTPEGHVTHSPEQVIAAWTVVSELHQTYLRRQAELHKRVLDLIALVVR